MEIPGDLRYADSHEWVRLEDDGLARVGITEYAQDALGDIVYVEFPDLGRELEAGESFGEIESTKSVAELYAPVAGAIEAVNEALLETPELVNQDPYGSGWLILIRLRGEPALDRLLDATAYGTLTE